ncbi:MAG: serine/threonine protein kinase [Sandaracinaceae bacterium]|nr:serine/threonine protein kinase [Sandaracinaceae bacterium]
MTDLDQASLELDDRTEVAGARGVERFGPYRVLQPLGQGGMGEVHLAVQTAPTNEPSRMFDRLVALKRLRPDLSADARFVQMFFDEARITTRLSHPNVCRVLDAGRIDGVAYLAMDLLVGIPLFEVIAHVRASTDRALLADWPFIVCKLGVDACEGLHAAHELEDEHGRPLGIVHRDVSPDNLFVGFDGVVRVIDFGIASARDKVHRTATGELRGKIAYASPERLTDARIDRRADVFSLGAVLWEAVALRPLFPHGDPGAAMRAIREGRVPPLRDACPDVPLELDVLVAQALAVEPSRRFSTARAMGEGLLDVMASEGRAVGAAHVAAFMDRLFAGAHARQSRLVSHALAERSSPGTSRSNARPVSGTRVSGTTLRLRDPKLPLVAALALLAGLGLGLGVGVWLTLGG